MAYSALTAFMDISPSAEDYARQAARQWAGKSEAELEALLIPEFAEFVRVKQENEELADLRRQVKNLEWRLKKDLVQPQPSPDQPLCDHPVSEIEQHLHQRVAELERALAPFADVFNGEGDSDYGDDEDVVLRCGRVGYFALTLGDFRRARATSNICPDCGLPDPPNNPYCFCSASPPTSGDRTESAPRSPVVEPK